MRGKYSKKRGVNKKEKKRAVRLGTCLLYVHCISLSLIYEYHHKNGLLSYSTAKEEEVRGVSDRGDGQT